MFLIFFSFGEFGLVFIFVVNLGYIELVEKNFFYMFLLKVNEVINFKFDINIVFIEKE